MISGLLGTTPVAVPPHVFAMDGARLCYAAFERNNGDSHLREYRCLDLPPETFLPGPLGGTLQESSGLRRALDQLLTEVGGGIAEGSLVVPDSWARISFVETAELPRSAKARDELLRWKLRRTVPYRVEDLRIRHLEVPALTGQEEPRRVLLVFLLDALFRQIEEVFAAAGVLLGSVSNETLSLLEAVDGAIANLDLAGVVHRTTEGYSLVFTRHGAPVIYRHKTIPDRGSEERLGVQIERDLRLTRKYLQDHVEGVVLRRVLLAAPEASTAVWSRWLEDVFEVPVTPVDRGWTSVGDVAPMEKVAPMVGAACRSR